MYLNDDNILNYKFSFIKTRHWKYDLFKTQIKFEKTSVPDNKRLLELFGFGEFMKLLFQSFGQHIVLGILLF